MMPGGLRAGLLLWLLSSGEALNVYSSVSVAASAPAGRKGAKAVGQHSEGDSGVQGESRGRARGLLDAFRREKRPEREQRAVVDNGGQSVAGGAGDERTCSAGHKHALTTMRGGHGGEESGVPLHIFKILLQVCLTTLNVACWLLPMKMRSFTESKTAIGVANAFSGGVFLSLAFGHMLPHAHHGFEGLDMPENFPYFLTLAGYMLIFFVEKIAFDAHGVMHDAEAHASEVVPVTNHNVKPQDLTLSGGSPARLRAGHGHSHHHHHNKPRQSGRSAVILLLALSVHSVFETMAMGLSDSKLSTSLLAMSIGLHQPAESLALLVSFLKSGMEQSQVIKLLCVFSAIGPLGMGLGILISRMAGKLTDAVLVAMAAGTFIYVGATEVIAEEFETPHHKWKKFSALIGGMVLIAFITNWAESLEHVGHSH